MEKEGFNIETSLLGDHERVQIGELRALLADDIEKSPSSDFEEVVGDIRLVRFLRSFKTVDDAAQNFRKMLEIREKYGMDKVRNEVMLNELDHTKAPHQEAMEKYAPLFYNWNSGRALNGDVISITRPANINVAELMKQITPEQLFANIRYHMEILNIQLDKYSRESGSLVKLLRIQDMDGVSMEFLGFVKNVIRPFIKEMQVTSSGALRTTYLINLPSFFSLVLEIMRPIFNEQMKQRIRPIKGAYKEELLEQCGALVLGKLEEARQVCPGTASYGLGKGSAKVPAWGKVEVNIIVKKGNVVKWDLAPDGALVFHANCFGVDGNAAIIKVNPDMTEKEKDEFESNQDGVLNLVFDNSAAWVSKRSVEYDIQLIEQEC